jgi:hypothetical protein
MIVSSRLRALFHYVIIRWELAFGLHFDHFGKLVDGFRLKSLL